MKTMKRLLALVLALLMLAALAACGSRDEDDEDDDRGSRRSRRESSSAREKDDDEKGGFSFGREKDREPDDAEKTPAAEPAEPAEPAAEPAEPVEEPAAEPMTVYEITVWVPEPAVETTRKWIDAFNAQGGDCRFEADVIAMAEGDAADRKFDKPREGADLFIIKQDELGWLDSVGALQPLGDGAAREINSRSIWFGCRSAENDGQMKAVPLSLYNGYFLYYDRSVISDADAGSLEKILTDCETSGRKIGFPLDNGWYLASFFFGAGCESRWIPDGNNGIVDVADTFYSPEGLAAARAVKRLTQSRALCADNGDRALAQGAAAVVSGDWDYSLMKSAYGENLGMTELPVFDADGTPCHLGSFAGSRLLCMMPQQDGARAAALEALACFLSETAPQMELYKACGWIPCDIGALGGVGAGGDPLINAQLTQSVYARPQGAIHGDWWMMMQRLYAQILDAKDDAGVQSALFEYDALVHQSVGKEKSSGWSVIGSFGGTSWDRDFPMKEISPNVFRSEKLHFSAGDEYKLRWQGSWELNYGENCEQDGANLVVSGTGDYYVELDLNAGKIALIPA